METGNRGFIVVVEDDTMIATLERKRLERAGYRVATSSTAEDAFARIAQGGADLIILDYSLSDGVTGLDFYEKLKAAGHDIPVIMVTGLSDEGTIIKALRAGVRDFVTKSLKYLDYLPEAVERVLAQERTRQALAQSQADLNRSASLLVSTLEATADGLLVIDRDGRIASFNTRFGTMWRIPKDVLDAKDAERVVRIMVEQLQDPDEYLVKVRELHADPLAASFDVLECMDGRVFERVSQPQMLSGEPVGRVWSFRDVTERKRAEERLSYLAHRDALTNLPNRMLLQDRLRQALVQANRTGTPVALMFLDLDRFKAINDTLGHVTGDLLLQAVAERVAACVRESDTVARLGGDEFTVVLTNLAQAQDAAKVAQKILDTLAKPFLLGGHELFITASIGITIYPTDESDIDGLLKNADAAMYRAKAQGRNMFQFYTEEMNARALERLTLENSLRHALERNEFLLHYQPQIDLRTGRISGVEALLRWRHPGLGLVSPSRFLPIAEDTGLIEPIGEWAIRAACIQSQAWQAAGLAPLRMAVNLSGRQFRDRRFIETIARILRDTDFPPLQLDLELTEDIVMEDAQATVAILRELNGMGLRFSIDDFGTGYSSLSQLKRFPIHVLKIDPSFVRDMTSQATDEAIVKSIIALAHSLRLTVIAEGVETREQVVFLRANSCDEIQGHFFSRALSAEGFTKLLESGRTLDIESLPDEGLQAA
jgi:diguanylate cyclase (GGDEF)-like protein/PAS domain S-box-containing protein